ncbi:MAG: hypothetical protein PUA84_07910 [Oscillospiraceae bacterium]|nr:hypothetical protein [Oscillospiraceae bacterium]
MNSNIIMRFNTERCFVPQNAEVMIVNESLIQDCGDGKLYARANFRNMSAQSLKKLVVDVYCRDASGQVIGKIENCTYNNLNAVSNSLFGIDTPFEVSFPNTASVVFVVKNVKYASDKPVKNKKEKKKRRKLWLIPCIIFGVLLVLAAVLYFILIPIFAGDIVEKDIEKGDYRSAYSTCITFENIGRAEAVADAKYNCIEKWVDSIITSGDTEEAEYFRENIKLKGLTYSSLCSKITNDVNANIEEGNFRTAYNTCLSFESISQEDALSEVKDDCVVKWADSIISSGDKDEAEYFKKNVKISTAVYPALYERVMKEINAHTTFDYWDDNWNSTSHSAVLNVFIQQLPDEYDDIALLKKIFPEMVSGDIHPLGDYLVNNQDLINDLLDSDIKFAGDYLIQAANAYFNDFWLNDDENNAKILDVLLEYDSVEEHISSSNDFYFDNFMADNWSNSNDYYMNFTYDETEEIYNVEYNLPVPENGDVEYYEWIGNDYCVYYSDDEDKPVKRYTINIVSYYEIDVYCCFNKKTITLYRD